MADRGTKNQQINLADLWQTLTTPIYRIYDDGSAEAVNGEYGCCRCVAEGVWLYSSESEGVRWETEETIDKFDALGMLALANDSDPRKDNIY